jgi:hypothetical protein
MCAAARKVAVHCTQSTVTAEGDALESSPATDVMVGPATGFLGDLHIDGPRRLRHESDMGALPLQELVDRLGSKRFKLTKLRIRLSIVDAVELDERHGGDVAMGGAAGKTGGNRSDQH